MGRIGRLVKTGGQYCVVGPDVPSDLAQLALAVGYVNVVCNPGQGVMDVLKSIPVPPGAALRHTWWHDRGRDELPDAVRVGQVLVRSGDPWFPVYVVKEVTD